MNDLNIWVYAEQRNGEILDVSLELLGKARELGSQLGWKPAAVLCGQNLAGKTEKLFAAGAEAVYLVENETLACYRPDVYPYLIEQLVNKYHPQILLFGATAVGRDLAPSAAARLNTGCSADCCDLEIDENGILQQIVPAFGGRVMATIVTPAHCPQIATVRPGVFNKPELATGSGKVYRPDIELPASRLELLDYRQEPVNPQEDITRAATIVGGGAGIKEDRGWELIRQLVSKLGGATAGTRPALDERRIAESQMIGQSGYSIRPDLYIAAGISGDIQHMIGVRDARVIVAINRDPGAPIFKQVDYGIVGDYREILPALLEELNKN